MTIGPRCCSNCFQLDHAAILLNVMSISFLEQLLPDCLIAYYHGLSDANLHDALDVISGQNNWLRWLLRS